MDFLLATDFIQLQISGGRLTNICKTFNSSKPFDIKKSILRNITLGVLVKVRSLRVY